MDERERLRRKCCEARLKFECSETPRWYDDPLYYAADKIRAKRRQKYSSSRPLTIVRDERRVVPPPTNGESK